ncbi:HIRAN domain-containing protein [Psychrobacillus sp. L4]|uniref:HIRAN domain-containing protein n=1 Tax=Psychrobacillus sp. L4 TaxID=3236892 RepID=UPI0036F23A7C
MTEHKSLWVVWQNVDTRLYYHIGTLSYFDEHYEFTYTFTGEGPQKVRDALENGYMLHPSFPILDKTYVSSKLFPAFDRRLPSEIRSDFGHILDELHLTESSSKMDLLEQTRGKLANDTYSFEKPLRIENAKLMTSFFIHGMRHQKDLPENWYAILRSFNTIELKPEPNNEVDANAIAIYTELGIKLGFIPRFYATGLSALLAMGIQPIIKVNYINEQSNSDWWVKVDFESDVLGLSDTELKKLDPLFEYAV